MKITALAGGVGGAKLAHGLSKILTPADLKIVVNTADDFIHYGLNISPDLDTVCYTLAELNSLKHGWGRKGETFRAFSSAVQLGGPDWFTLGDLDLGLHLERTRLLRAGKTLSEVTGRLSRSLGIQHEILPMSDDKVSSILVTKNGEQLPFQEYFVKNRFAPKVKQILFDGLHNANPTDLVLQALAGCDTVIICPSNPFVSIGPILALPGVKQILKRKIVIAVSPIIGGQAVKGPLAKMMREMDFEVSPVSVAEMYKGFLNVLYIDEDDLLKNKQKVPSGIIIKRENILIPDLTARINLARKIIKDLK